MATHQRVHLGKAEEKQKLEEDPQSSQLSIQTFNLIEFLLKNGPPSIISNFKYDLYQLRVFESYSNYVEGLDKGEPSTYIDMQFGKEPKSLWVSFRTKSNSKRKD